MQIISAITREEVNASDGGGIEVGTLVASHRVHSQTIATLRQSAHPLADVAIAEGLGSWDPALDEVIEEEFRIIRIDVLAVLLTEVLSLDGHFPSRRRGTIGARSREVGVLEHIAGDIKGVLLAGVDYSVVEDVRLQLLLGCFDFIDGSIGFRVDSSGGRHIHAHFFCLEDEAQEILPGIINYQVREELLISACGISLDGLGVFVCGLDELPFDAIVAVGDCVSPGIRSRSTKSIDTQAEALVGVGMEDVSARHLFDVPATCTSQITI